MNKINDLPLKKLLPESIRNDPDIIAAANSIDLGFFQLADKVNNIIILPNIEGVSENVLDHLAYFFHVDFYDLNFEFETKRNLVRDSIFIHQIKGTPLAVERLIQTIFGEGEVSEWYDYNGMPYHFRVITNNESVTNERAEEFMRALNTVKNVRSVLDSIIILQNEKMNLYWGGFIHIGSKEKYR